MPLEEIQLPAGFTAEDKRLSYENSGGRQLWAVNDCMLRVLDAASTGGFHCGPRRGLETGVQPPCPARMAGQGKKAIIWTVRRQAPTVYEVHMPMNPL